MNVVEMKDIHYPVEYLIFKCRNEEEAKHYLQTNTIWTNELAKYKGFVSSSCYLNHYTPGEVHVVIIWETLEDWLSIPKSELQRIAQQFDEAFALPYENGRRIHTENNFGLHKVRHYEVRR